MIRLDNFMQQKIQEKFYQEQLLNFGEINKTRNATTQQAH